jgi:hypothetical protein
LTVQTPDSGVASEQPILWLGLSGFGPQQRAALEALLVRPAGLPRWRVSAFGEADAWWVNGSKIRLTPDGNLKVAAGLPTEHTLQLNLGDVDRPVAFSEPLASRAFEPQCTFDLNAPASISAALLQFDNWLRHVRSEFVLGGQIIERADDRKHAIFHVSLGGNLLAVLDFQDGKAAISPRAHPVDLAEAQWDRRPIGARDMPETFVRSTPAQLAWTHVRRTDRDLLPARYREHTIYFCRAPGVPMRWLRDSQLMLLRELSFEPGTFQELRQRTGLAVSPIEHDLACLYYSGAITTTRKKAAKLAADRYDSRHNSADSEDESTSGSSMDSLQADDMTAPARLEHRRGPTPKPESENEG